MNLGKVQEKLKKYLVSNTNKNKDHQKVSEKLFDDNN